MSFANTLQHLNALREAPLGTFAATVYMRSID